MAFAQPYLWFPGSPIDTDNQTSDKVVVVDGATDAILTPAGGWDYTETSSGALSFTPAFSPDGTYV